ncbi:hypothetical protein PIB30_003379 [Stylosanthes scabra]|uniref:ARID domain-containing protein n=1 Tax=Stylosanthes scabra TaxID=79078 RepID=A0ABU6T339_9FABA|nr:hypothetical protein [Stylosanthes scabra]
MASTSCVSNIPLLPTLTWNNNSHQNPAPLAKYEEVTTNSKLFMSTLEKLHADMGTKFMIPTIGGKKLDLFHLFIEVTSRGGIEKIIKERRWKEVTQTFNFPSTATNASFVLRKYYSSLFYHYEQIYYFRVVSGWNPGQFQSNISTPIRRAQFSQPSLTFQHASRVDAASESSKGTRSSTTVVGVIDAKFKSGYLNFVSIGSEVYQEKVLGDKERYKEEMKDYHQKLRMMSNNNNSLLQQGFHEADKNLVDMNIRMDENDEGSLQSQTPKEESTSGGSENGNDINMDSPPPPSGILRNLYFLP